MIQRDAPPTDTPPLQTYHPWKPHHPFRQHFSKLRDLIVQVLFRGTSSGVGHVGRPGIITSRPNADGSEIKIFLRHQMPKRSQTADLNLR